MNKKIYLINSNMLAGNRGFTIIEVLMAMAIFLIGFLAVGSMQISAVNGNKSARMRTSASVLAADIVEQLMRCPYKSSTCKLTRSNATSVNNTLKPIPWHWAPTGHLPMIPMGTGPIVPMKSDGWWPTDRSRIPKKLMSS